MQASDRYYREDVSVDIRNRSGSVCVSVAENGDIHANLLNQIEISPTALNQSADMAPVLSESELTGTTVEGDEIRFDDVILSTKDVIDSDHKRYVDEIKAVAKITIDGTNEYVSRDESVTIAFDVSCFKPSIPISSTDIELIRRDDWAATASPLDDIEERIEQIKAYKIPIRTAKISITQNIPGTIEHQVNTAREKLEKILDLCGFVQGTGPTFFRASLDRVGGESIESTEEELKFVQFYDTGGNIGGAFKEGRIVWGEELTDYLDEAYDVYSSDIRDDLRLQNVLGYYTDSMNSTVAIQGRFLCVCSAIEMIAKRYSDLYEHNSGTGERIEYLVDELNVETSDLRSFVSKPDESLPPVYFYRGSRIYLVHGDGNPPIEKLLRDFSAATVLLQRIIRNQLIGAGTADEYSCLGELNPNEYTE